MKEWKIISESYSCEFLKLGAMHCGHPSRPVNNKCCKRYCPIKLKEKNDKIR